MTPLETAFWRGLRRLMPLFAPGKGWVYTLQRIEAHELGVGMRLQAELAEQMTRLGTHQVRTETNPTWNLPAANWSWAQATEAGAEGEWLNLWGRVYAVGRWPRESDTRYSARILSTVIRPTTTNVGMAIAIDEALGITGTVVQDSLDYLEGGPRYNQHGRRYNLTKFWQVPPYPLSWYLATFRVILPGGVVEPPVFRAFVDRLKAAGTKLLEVVSPPDGGFGYGRIYGYAYGAGSD